MENNVQNTIADVFNEIAQGLESGNFGSRPRVGVTLLGSEHGEEEVLRGAELAQANDPSIEVVAIGTLTDTKLETVAATDPEDGHNKMDEMLADGRLDAAVTMHYTFPIGVSTVGRSTTPGIGKAMFLANTTGTSDMERISAMVKNTISGIGVAKANGIENPTVGILNIDGAHQVEKALNKLKDKGYDINFTQSHRADGGVEMRGNDLLQGVPDIMVMDSLTGNIITKVMSSFLTGGSYESVGEGYGPGAGKGYDKIINIVSRASGANVIAGALSYAGRCVKGNLITRVNAEYKAAENAGLSEILDGLTAAPKKDESAEKVKEPAKKAVSEAILGIDILVLEDAVTELWKADIYATSGMGCTGPVVMVAPEDEDHAREVLKKADYL
ncbi:glycine/sarcosine/betaine reductase complex component C subunit alpha [Companilactobacillus baiquanensis]|uniref:Glycine/sarcosine/betaine reductase complex component C subunit alpha n=1 Tax=Companilactobacillus baiquanensis TaxID=2486005 RepID=A0ABW1UYI9_9LACO|nr:glycine/sarcosine/betaine reductase complex component C subunit alpha [Companilactobacillus baiquanensis]